MARKKCKRFRKELRACLDRLRLTPNELARLSRFTASYIYSILAGERLPSLDSALKIIAVIERKIMREVDCDISPPEDCLDLMKSYFLDYLSSNREVEKAIEKMIECGVLDERF